MQFDLDSMAHLMGLLTDLYSNVILAVLREYSTNAWDSHVDAGNPNPIEITLPSHLDPRFIIKDQGVGLSEDEILYEFSHYGWSSKRETNDQVGSMGIGCKSAFAYTGQFVMVAIKDSEKVQVLLSRDDDGIPWVTVADKRPTDEPNGVTITIPVNDVDEFCETAEFFFGFWDPEIVRVNGEKPTSHWMEEGAVVLDNGVFLTPHLDYDYVVMGNIPYPLEAKHNIRGNKNLRAVAYVEMGSVKYSPSRESLEYNALTHETLNTAREWIGPAIAVKAQEQINAATSLGEAHTLATYWREALPQNIARKLTYRNERIPYQLRLEGLVWWHSSYRGKARSYTLSISQLKDYLIVTGFKGKGIPRTTKDATSAYILANALPFTEIVYCSSIPPWMSRPDQQTVVPLSEVLKYKPVAVKQPRAKTRYNLYSGAETDDVSDYHELILVTKHELERFSRLMGNINNWVRSEGSVLVVIRTNQEAKFLREHDNALTLKTYVEQAFKRMFNNDPWDAVFFVDCPRFGFSTDAKAIEVDDPMVKSWIAAKNNHDAKNLYGMFQAVERVMQSYRLKVEIPEQLVETGRNLLRQLEQRYPLSCGNYYRSDTKATIEYMNIFYHAKYSNQAERTK